MSQPTSNTRSFVLILISLALTSACTRIETEAPTPSVERPNILLIVADDMGYTDIGAFGSEIRTPNLDELAFDGVRLTNFHAAAQCAPTRSMLLSGSDNHKAGMGSMFGPNMFRDFPVDRVGYERYLHPRVATLAERLGDAGYHTYVAGKWHLGEEETMKPSAKGFDRTFVFMGGSTGHMEMRAHHNRVHYRQDGVRLEELPDDFYSTNTYTDKMIEFITANSEDDRPFFGYLALTSPHWPLQVPAEELGRYAGQYDEGYDVLRAGRIHKASELGVVPRVDPALFDPAGSRWADLSDEEQRYSARTMELYAAMVENMDDNVGRIIAHLKSTGQFENTFIFFMSDNGAEADREDKNPTFVRAIERSQYYENSYENLGKASSFAFLREGWAQATMAPYRLYKGFLSEGGTRVSSFAHHPTLASSGKIDNQYLTVMDVMPTFLGLANAEFDPASVRGREVLPMDGKSMQSALRSSARVHGADEVIASELHGQRALVRGDWKIVWEQMTANIWWEGEKPDHWRSWRLFNLADDPTEQHDLAADEPEILTELTALWNEWAEANGVIIEVTPQWR
jgi:arylsulfatase A-like enzyme